MSQDKSYDDLTREADARWRQSSQAYAARLQTKHEQMLNSPDVLNAPAIGSELTAPEMVCRCGQCTYAVLRYACINGIKHRTELCCAACGRVATWDFAESRWLN